MKNKLLTRKQYEEWFNSHKGECLLCDTNEQIVLKEYNDWVWIINVAPYWRYHTMVIPKTHKLHLSEITSAEWTEFKVIYEDIMRAYKKAKLKHADGADIVKYLIFIRARDYSLDHSDDIKRPEHLHIHFLPDNKGKFDPLVEEDAHKIPISEIIKKLGGKLADK